MAVGCSCLFAPSAVPRARRAEPALRGVATVDESGIVVEYRPPTPEQQKLAAHARLSEREKLERLLWQRIEWAGLPLPVLQYHWAKSEGRQFRSDGAYVAERILLEVQGGIWAQDPGRHNRGSGYERDCDRDNLAALLGWKLLRFTERMIKDGTAVQTILRALGRADPAQRLLIGGEH
jgi:very-short-patch-repair endonuclease